MTSGTRDQLVGAVMRPATVMAVNRELKRARRLHPGREQLTVALMEEVGELAQALLQGKRRTWIVAEALQVAVVAIRIAEEGDGSFDRWRPGGTSNGSERKGVSP